MNTAPGIERARRLLADLKALYDQLREDGRDIVREQFAFCAEHCASQEEVHV